ncbi:MAG: 4Fe-4S dicluster domain-containing protein [bacterium]|nr:4Fe-4S dicluster domain-containing protein [bacterium]
MNQERKIGRKDFFTEGPKSFLRAFFDGMRESDNRRFPPDDLNEGPLLRPPGAAPEKDFLSICTGTGDCARACPAEAILMYPRTEGEDTFALQPVIRAADSPCVVCDELACMKACPTGALTLVPRESIRMGRAEVHPDECLAILGQDEDCRFCVDRCPIGATAIRIESWEGKTGPVVKDGCVGCGVCEFHCPVYPGAIRVIPYAGL